VEWPQSWTLQSQTSPELQLLIHDLLVPAYQVYWKRTCSAFYAISALSKCPPPREDPHEQFGYVARLALDCNDLELIEPLLRRGAPTVLK
jgi:hypothetical protein